MTRPTSYRKRYAPNRVGEFSVQDHRTAAAEALAISYGVPIDARERHPLTDAVLRDGSPFGILDAAETAIDLAYGEGAIPPRDGSDGFNTIVRAMSTADLPAIIEQTIRGIARERQSEELDAILALTSQMELPNYHAQSYSVVDLEGLPAPGELTGNQYHFANVKITGETIQVYSLFARILVSRQALVNDDRGFVRSAVNAFLSSAARNELGMIVNLIQSTANLHDGAPLFHANTANLAVAPLDATGLGTAISTLRKQPTESGEPCGAQARALLVHSDDEVAALRLMETLPIDRRPVVVSTSRLATAASWYVLANPETFPVIGRSRMLGAELSGVGFGGFEPAIRRDPSTGKMESYPGLALPASHSIGYNVLSRIGIVKLTKT